MDSCIDTAMNSDGWTQFLPASLPVLARIGGIVACAPPFAAAAVPRRVRALFAIALTVGLSSTIATTPLPQTLPGLILAVAGEALIGIALGLAMSLLFVAAQWTGSLMAMQLGFNLGESFDPASESIGSSIGHGYWLLTIVTFMAINGHHALIRGIQSSFSTLPILKVADGAALLDMFVKMLGAATSLAVRLAMPVFVTMFIVDLALGMVGRTLPQVGLMTANIAVRSITGLLVMLLCMTVAAVLLQSASGGWFAAIQSALTGK